MRASSREAVRQEALRLRAFLSRNVPLRVAMRREVESSPDESELLRTFWSVIGWSPDFGAWLAEPEVARAPAQAERFMREWRSWGGDFKLTVEDLPRRFRVVELDHQGVGFSITDESSGDVEDPPLLAVSADEGTLSPLSSSYLRFVGTSLLMLAVEGWYSTTVMCGPEVLEIPGGKRPFPLLGPGIVALSEELWVLPTSSLGIEPGVRFAHASHEALLMWLTNTSTLRAIHIPRLPGKVWNLEGVTLAQVDDAVPGLRRLAGLTDDMAFRVGSLEGVCILIRESPSGGVALAHSARHVERVRHALEVRGLFLAPRG